MEKRCVKAPGTPRWHDRKVLFFQFLQGKDKPYSAKFGAEVSKMKTPGA